MENPEDDVCAVCMESLGTENVHAMDVCGHRFHCGCIIGWLQRGHLSCPTCRGDLHRHAESISGMALHERAKHIRRTVGRRASAPAELKRIIASVKRAEAAEREHRRTVKEFRTRHRDTLKEYDALRRKSWTTSRATRRSLRLLGLYSSPNVPLPALMVVGD